MKEDIYYGTDYSQKSKTPMEDNTHISRIQDEKESAQYLISLGIKVEKGIIYVNQHLYDVVRNDALAKDHISYLTTIKEYVVQLIPS